MSSKEMFNSDETLKLLEELLSDKPSKTSSDILNFIEMHKGKALSIPVYGNFIKWFEDLFEELNITIQLLNYVPKDKWKDNRKLQYALFPGAMKTLHRAFEDATESYYDESVMLNRSVFETFLLIVYASCYSKDCMSHIPAISRGKGINLTDFFEQKLKLDWKWLYRLMSIIYHSKKHKLLKTLTGQYGKSLIISIDYSWDGTTRHGAKKHGTVLQNTAAVKCFDAVNF